MPAGTYTGRFAPTPSGPLHFGSIVAALGSWLDARAAGGRWLVRIEDLDTPRIRAGADASILKTLERLGLQWDGGITRQSDRLDAYAGALDSLRRQDVLFHCACPRRRVKAGPYPGTCRNLGLPEQGSSLRVRVPDLMLAIADDVLGVRHGNLRDHGDFIVRRSDGFFAYNLSVVVDDAWQQVTHVVRGADLLHTTPAQVHLHRLLGLPQPRYGHLPVVLDPEGRKMSKRWFAEEALLERSPAELLYRALEFLGQRPDPELRTVSPAELLEQGLRKWSRDSIPKHDGKLDAEQE